MTSPVEPVSRAERREKKPKVRSDVDDDTARGNRSPECRSEIAVLAGAANLLREHRPVVICELHETNLEVEALLGAASYDIENLDGPKPIRVAGAAHILARPATPTS